MIYVYRRFDLKWAEASRKMQRFKAFSGLLQPNFKRNRYSRFGLKWAEDEPILRTHLRRIGNRGHPISTETTVLQITRNKH